MNSFVAVLLAVVVVAQAATIKSKNDDEARKPLEVEESDISLDAKPLERNVRQYLAERNGRQVYPAGYEAPLYAPAPAAPAVPLKAVYSPYPAYPVPSAYPVSYYPSAYPNFPGQYYPLREGESGAEEGSSWSSYLPSSFGSIGNYFSSFQSNYPAYYPAWLGGSESETASAPATPATPSEAEAANSPAKAGIIKATNNVHNVNSIKPYGALDAKFRYQQPQPVQPQFIIAGQPQLYGAYSPFQAQQDPSKLTAANNGAISSYLFLRNQPQLPIYQQNQQKFAAPATFQNGNVKDSHQQFVHYAKELQGESSKQVDHEAAPSTQTEVVQNEPVQPEEQKQAAETEEPKKDATTGQ